MITNLSELLIQTTIVIVVGLISLKMSALNITGFIAAVIIGNLVMIFGSIKWFIILVTLLSIAVAATRFKYTRKRIQCFFRQSFGQHFRNRDSIAVWEP